MSKEALVGKLSDATGFTKKSAGEFLDVLPKVLRTMLSFGAVRINHLGTFEIKVRGARTGRNPQTGEPVSIPEKKILTFKPAKTMKEAIDE
jgi:DNA-binding protein HU-beta